MTNPTNPRALSTADMAARQPAVEPAPDPGRMAPADGGREQRAAPRDNQRSQTEERAMPLLDEGEAGSFRSQWALIQASFVDEPRSAVEQGDALVAELMQRLAEIFAAERRQLEEQWNSGGDVSTEDLRLALRRYRSFFDRLLSL
jgi:hypothetical protein